MHAPAAGCRKPPSTWGNAAGPGLHNVHYRTYPIPCRGSGMQALGRYGSRYGRQFVGGTKRALSCSSRGSDGMVGVSYPNSDVDASRRGGSHTIPAQRQHLSGCHSMNSRRWSRYLLGGQSGWT